MTQQTVLLTGGRGFTGIYLQQALEANGYRVAHLVQQASEPNDYEVSLLDVATLQSAIAQVKPDYVIHLAAIAHVMHSDQREMYDVNVFGTLNLLDAIASHASHVKKVILASSANVYGNPPVAKVSEAVAPAPVNHYAMTKLSMEYMARTYQDRLPIVIVRPFNYTGLGQSKQFLIPKIVTHFQERASTISLGNLDVIREFNDVRDVAKAYVGLMEAAPSGLTVNLCSGVGYPLMQVIDLCQELTGYTIEVQVNPAFVRANELKELVGDPALLAQYTQPLGQLTLRDTLKWMLAV